MRLCLFAVNSCQFEFLMLSQLFRSLKSASTAEYHQASEPQPEAAASEAQQAVLDAVELCYLKAEAALGHALKRPSVSFALRGRSAGTAHPTENRLRFNPVLLEKTCTPSPMRWFHTRSATCSVSNYMARPDLMARSGRA